jgi:hypothetical protein
MGDGSRVVLLVEETMTCVDGGEERMDMLYYLSRSNTLLWSSPDRVK